MDANGVQEAAAGDGGRSDRTARARSSSQPASGARAVAAAMLGRRPARRGASAGVAAAIEAAASADSLEDVGSDSEAYAVAAAAAATAAQRGWLETEPGTSACLLRCRSSRHLALGLRVVYVELTGLPALRTLAAVGCSCSMAGCRLCSPQHPICAPAGCCCLCRVHLLVCGGRAV